MSIWVVLFMIVCNMTAMKGSKVIITLFSIQLGAPQIIIGILVGLYSLFPMILAITAGKLTDRLGARLPMVVGSLVLSLGLTLPYFFPYTATLYLQAMLIGAGHVFYNVSVQNMIGGMSTNKTERTKNFSNFGLAMSAGSFIGPLAAGFAIDHIGHRYAYLALAFTPLITAAIMGRAKHLAKPASIPAVEVKEKKAGEESPSGSFGLLKGNRALRRALLTGAVILTGIDLFHFYMPIYGHYIGLSASQIGIVLGTFSAAAFVVRVWMPAIVARFGPEKVLVGSLFAAAITYTAVPFITAAIMGRAKHLAKPASIPAVEVKERKGGEESPSGSFGLLKGNRALRRALLTGAVILTGIDLFHFYMPIYGHHIGLSASQIGIVLGTFSAAAFVVRVWMPAIVARFGPEKVLVGSLFAAAITYTAVPFITLMIPLCIVCFILGLGTGCGQPLTLQLIYERAPNGRSGEAIGLRSTLNNFTHIVTPLAFGALGTAFGVMGVFFANSLMLASGGFVIRRK